MTLNRVDRHLDRPGVCSATVDGGGKPTIVTDYRKHPQGCIQPDELFRLMSDSQKQPLLGNTAAAMQGVPEEIVPRRLGHFARADPAYAASVAKALGIKP